MHFIIYPVERKERIISVVQENSKVTFRTITSLASPFNALFLTIVSGLLYNWWRISVPGILRSTSHVGKHPRWKIYLSETSFSEVHVQISGESEKRIMLFVVCWGKWRRFYPRTDELWRAETWPKLVSSLVSYMLAAVIRPQSLPSAVFRIIG